MLSFLCLKMATEACDLILKLPVTDPYKILNEQLIKGTAASEQRHLQQLFNSEELGDKKTTQLLRHVQQLLGDHAGVTDRELFLQQLPSNVRMMLASTSTTTGLKELSKLTDKIIELAIPTVAATTTPQASPHLFSELKQLRTEMKQLQQTVQKLSRQPHERSSSHRCTSSPTLPPTRDTHSTATHPVQPHLPLVTRYGGIITTMAKQLRNANLPTLTLHRPVIRGNKCVQLSQLSPSARN